MLYCSHLQLNSSDPWGQSGFPLQYQNTGMHCFLSSSHLWKGIQSLERQTSCRQTNVTQYVWICTENIIVHTISPPIQNIKEKMKLQKQATEVSFTHCQEQAKITGETPGSASVTGVHKTQIFISKHVSLSRFGLPKNYLHGVFSFIWFWSTFVIAEFIWSIWAVHVTVAHILFLQCAIVSSFWYSCKNTFLLERFVFFVTKNCEYVCAASLATRKEFSSGVDIKGGFLLLEWMWQLNWWDDQVVSWDKQRSLSLGRKYNFFFKITTISTSVQKWQLFANYQFLQYVHLFHGRIKRGKSWNTSAYPVWFMENSPEIAKGKHLLILKWKKYFINLTWMQVSSAHLMYPTKQSQDSQLSSSARSLQSFCPSHTKAWWRHFELSAHFQGLASGQPQRPIHSSDPSLQCLVPSHSNEWWMHLDLSVHFQGRASVQFSQVSSHSSDPS